ncbi:MAG: 4-hydroxy-3-methylbut-2-enyl diphosphate reductase, partial [Actinobacteria bacterium]|nr:4-hydroxy-3-methylbut-2-enyl diphosphate reductase [Actinomycetota bacterium]
IAILAQTTQSLAAFEELVAEVVHTRLAGAMEISVHNTICSATERRQAAAVAMAAAVDVVLVVGGKNSGNTTRLAELCAAVQPRTHHIESAEEIRAAWLEGAAIVGITAGASTPPEQIEAAAARLRELVP